MEKGRDRRQKNGYKGKAKGEKRKAKSEKRKSKKRKNSGCYRLYIKVEEEEGGDKPTSESSELTFTVKVVGVGECV